MSPLSGAWPFLVVEQRYGPDVAGFDPGLLLIPGTGLLLVGAGIRLLAYSLTGPHHLWEDRTNLGFWHWDRQEDTVLMAAELELAAWDLDARKLWTTFVELPWTSSRTACAIWTSWEPQPLPTRHGTGETHWPPRP